MKELLLEFLADLLGEADSAAAKQAKAAKLKSIPNSRGLWSPTGKKPATASTKDGKFTLITPEKPTVAKKAVSKTTTEPQVPAAKVTKPRAPRIKRTKIEKIPSDRNSVVSSFGDTSLDVDGLMKAVEGVVSDVKGEKGAGTAASTAGEAATTLSLEKLRSLRTAQSGTSTEDFLKQNMPEVVKLLSELRGIKGSALTEDWAESARKQVMAMFKTIEETYNVKISEIAWDNANGRTALGLGPKPKTDRSDLYVKGSDGQIIGISLKKDGNIFLANQGLRTVLDSIAEKAPDEETANKITSISESHKQTFEKELNTLLSTSKSKSRELSLKLKKLNRADIDDVPVKYDEFFDKNGNLTKETIAVLLSGGVGTGRKQKYTENERKLFLKVMAAISDDTPAVKTSLENMRAADRKATQSLLELVRTDEGVNETMTDYLIDSLDLVQLVTPDRPFGADYPVDKFFIAYGESNLQEDGQEFPMSVTRDTILSTLDLPKDITDEQLKIAVKEKFVVDADGDSKVGFLRLRIKNQTPPPNYFYPSISTLAIRARGLGTPPTMELAQHSGWTYTLLNKSPNPKTWPPHQRYAQAEDSMLFLSRQLRNTLLTAEQKIEIANDIEFYKEQMRNSNGS
jgi:hypothetical protein